MEGGNRSHWLQPPRNLEAIEKEVSKISAVVNSKRKRHKLAAAFWANTHATTLQKCRGDLDWAMKLFDVSTCRDIQCLPLIGRM